jgi:hypothetical protein
MLISPEPYLFQQFSLFNSHSQRSISDLKKFLPRSASGICLAITYVARFIPPSSSNEDRISYLLMNVLESKKEMDYLIFQGETTMGKEVTR